MAAIKIPCAWMIIRVGSRVRVIIPLLLHTATLRPLLGYGEGRLQFIPNAHQSIIFIIGADGGMTVALL